MNFVKAVKNTKGLCLKDGLQALKGEHRVRVRVDDTREFKGSVNIEACVKPNNTGKASWDYVFGYKDKIYYVEVHQAIAREVKTVISKVKWLKDWLATSAKDLENLSHLSSYHWIATERGGIKLRQTYLKQLAQNGIGPPQRVLNIREQK